MNIKALKIALTMIPESQRATTPLGSAAQIAWLIAEVERLGEVVENRNCTVGGLMVDAAKAAVDGFSAGPAGDRPKPPTLIISGNVCEIGELEDEGGQHGIRVRRGANFVTVKGLTMPENKALCAHFLNSISISFAALAEAEGG